MSATVAERVIRACSDHAWCPASADSHLVDDLKLDSLDRIDLALRLEDEFGIEIPDEDVDRPDLATVAGLIAYIEGKLA